MSKSQALDMGTRGGGVFGIKSLVDVDLCYSDLRTCRDFCASTSDLWSPKIQELGTGIGN